MLSTPTCVVTSLRGASRAGSQPTRWQRTRHPVTSRRSRRNALVEFRLDGELELRSRVIEPLNSNRGNACSTVWFVAQEAICGVAFERDAGRGTGGAEASAIS